jgi:CheY-like chemotaxis protein
VLILTAKHITSEEIAFLKGKAIHQLVQKGDVCRDGLLSAVQNMVVLQAPSENENELLVPRLPRPIRSRPVRSRPVVLIVEDKPDNLLTAKALIQEHYEPLGASDGEEGLALAKKEEPDLILLDISLPGMDGFQVFDALRQDKATESIPVVALTAKAMKGDREEILLHGFDGYLAKPVDAELLEETIRRFFHGE